VPAWAVNAFIVAYLAATVAASMPGPAQRTPLRQLRAAARPLMLRAGLWQGWDMFARPPTTVDALEGQVRLADGTSVTWAWPRMEALGYLQRYRQERYRKYGERLRLPEHRAAWPDAARFVARRVAGAGSRPQEVTLVRRWAPIPPPVGPSLPPRLRHATLDHAEAFFRYAVRPGDLP
jgi:hypothetical protein